MEEEFLLDDIHAMIENGGKMPEPAPEEVVLPEPSIKSEKKKKSRSKASSREVSFTDSAKDVSIPGNKL